MKNKNKILENFKTLKNKLGKNWKDQIELLESLLLKNDLSFTIVDGKTRLFETFSDDNRDKLVDFLLYLTTFQKENDLNLTIFISYLNFAFMEKGVPLKYMSGCLMFNNGILNFSPETVEENTTKNIKTGEKTDKEFQTVYIEFNDLLEKVQNEQNIVLQ